MNNLMRKANDLSSLLVYRPTEVHQYFGGTLVDFCWTTLNYISEDSISQHCAILKSNKLYTDIM